MTHSMSVPIGGISVGLFDKLRGKISKVAHEEPVPQVVETPEQHFAKAMAYERGNGVTVNPEKAVEHYLIAAEAGHKEAAVRLGTLLSQADYLEEGEEKWIEIAAQNGDALACWRWGAILYGQKTNEPEKVLHWLSHASELGVAEASELAGRVLLSDLNDSQRAKAYFLKALEQGHKEAYARLAACCYAMKEYDDAQRWAVAGAEQQNAICYHILAKLHQEGLIDEAGGMEAAVDYYDQASILGHAASSYWLGQYYNGKYGGKRDEKMWKHYMTLAMSQGHMGAQYEVAMYGLNHLGEEGVKASVALLEECAVHKHLGAIFNLGMMYVGGDHVKTDYSKAMLYLKKAAEMGMPAAELQIARMYMRGMGVNDPALGVNIMHKLADSPKTDIRIRAEALFDLGKTYSQGVQGVQQNISLGIKMLTESAELGNDRAIYELATYYVTGEPVEQDDSLAIEWLRKGCEKGYGPSFSLLAHMEEHGLGMVPNPNVAREHYCVAAEAGVAHALYRMYEVYHDGQLEAEKDLDKAEAYLARAIEADSPEAWCRTGRIYLRGEDGKQQDFNKAKKCFEVAISLENGEACHWLALMYAKGDGVKEQDLIECCRLCQLAIKYGYDRAKQTLEKLDKLGVHTNMK